MVILLVFARIVQTTIKLPKTSLDAFLLIKLVISDQDYSQIPPAHPAQIISGPNKTENNVAATHAASGNT